ncbi:MAG: hypothetical protein WD060_04350, partial [Pirellulales bacterium]
AAARAAFDGLAAARAAFDSLAAARLTCRDFLAMAAGSLLGAMTGQETLTLTMALLGLVTGQETTVATVAGDRAGVATDKGDGHDRDEHRKCKTEITLHKNLQ